MCTRRRKWPAVRLVPPATPRRRPAEAPPIATSSPTTTDRRKESTKIMSRELVVYSGRNRPDLTPIYSLFEKLTGTQLTVEKVYHHDAETRVIAEMSDPQADVLLTNSQLALEAVRESG